MTVHRWQSDIHRLGFSLTRHRRFVPPLYCRIAQPFVKRPQDFRVRKNAHAESPADRVRAEDQSIGRVVGDEVNR